MSPHQAGPVPGAVRPEGEDSAEHAPVDGRRPARSADSSTRQHAHGRGRLRPGAFQHVGQWRRCRIRFAPGARIARWVWKWRRWRHERVRLARSRALRLPGQVAAHTRGLPQRAEDVRTPVQRVHHAHNPLAQGPGEDATHRAQRDRPHGAHHTPQVQLHPGAAQAEHVRVGDDTALALLGRAPQAPQLLQAGQGDTRRLLLFAPEQSVSVRGGQGGVGAQVRHQREPGEQLVRQQAHPLQEEHRQGARGGLHVRRQVVVDGWWRRRGWWC